MVLTDLVSVAMGRSSPQGVLHGNYSAGATIVVIVALSLALGVGHHGDRAESAFAATDVGGPGGAGDDVFRVLIGPRLHVRRDRHYPARVDLPWTSRLRSCDRTVQHDPVDWHWQPTL